MAFKFNIFTGTLDIAGTAGSGTGNVTGIPPTTPTAIARWVDSMGTTIENSQALVQDSGAIEAQGFITRRSVTGNVIVNAGETWIAPSLEVSLTGSIVIESGGDIIMI